MVALDAAGLKPYISVGGVPAHWVNYLCNGCTTPRAPSTQTTEARGGPSGGGDQAPGARPRRTRACTLNAILAKFCNVWLCSQALECTRGDDVGTKKTCGFRLARYSRGRTCTAPRHTAHAHTRHRVTRAQPSSRAAKRETYGRRRYSVHSVDIYILKEHGVLLATRGASYSAVARVSTPPRARRSARRCSAIRWLAGRA